MSGGGGGGRFFGEGEEGNTMDRTMTVDGGVEESRGGFSSHFPYPAGAAEGTDTGTVIKQYLLHAEVANDSATPLVRL